MTPCTDSAPGGVEPSSSHEPVKEGVEQTATPGGRGLDSKHITVAADVVVACQAAEADNVGRHRSSITTHSQNAKRKSSEATSNPVHIKAEHKTLLQGQNVFDITVQASCAEMGGAGAKVKVQHPCAANYGTSVKEEDIRPLQLGLMSASHVMRGVAGACCRASLPVGTATACVRDDRGTEIISKLGQIQSSSNSRQSCKCAPKSWAELLNDPSSVSKAELAAAVSLCENSAVELACEAFDKLPGHAPPPIDHTFLKPLRTVDSTAQGLCTPRKWQQKGDKGPATSHNNDPEKQWVSTFPFDIQAQLLSDLKHSPTNLAKVSTPGKRPGLYSPNQRLKTPPPAATQQPSDQARASLVHRFSVERTGLQVEQPGKILAKINTVWSPDKQHQAVMQLLDSNSVNREVRHPTTNAGDPGYQMHTAAAQGSPCSTACTWTPTTELIQRTAAAVNTARKPLVSAAQQVCSSPRQDHGCSPAVAASQLLLDSNAVTWMPDIEHWQVTARAGQNSATKVKAAPVPLFDGSPSKPVPKPASSNGAVSPNTRPQNLHKAAHTNNNAKHLKANAVAHEPAPAEEKGTMILRHTTPEVVTVTVQLGDHAAQPVHFFSARSMHTLELTCAADARLQDSANIQLTCNNVQTTMVKPFLLQPTTQTASFCTGAWRVDMAWLSSSQAWLTEVYHSGTLMQNLAPWSPRGDPSWNLILAAGGCMLVRRTCDNKHALRVVHAVAQ